MSQITIRNIFNKISMRASYSVMILMAVTWRHLLAYIVVIKC